MANEVGRMKQNVLKAVFRCNKIPSISFIPYSSWEKTVFNRDISFEIIRSWTKASARLVAFKTSYKTLTARIEIQLLASVNILYIRKTVTYCENETDVKKRKEKWKLLYDKTRWESLSSPVLPLSRPGGPSNKVYRYLWRHMILLGWFLDSNFPSTSHTYAHFLDLMALYNLG